MERDNPRVLTLTLPDKHQPKIEINGTSHLLRNFSENGLGVWVSSEFSSYRVGEKVSAFFCLQEKKYSTVLEVIHITQNVCGLRFVDLPLELRVLLKEMLAPARLGASLLPGNPSRQVDKDGNIQFNYLGMADCELLITVQPEQKKITKLQLTWNGYLVQRSENQPVQTGNITLSPEASRFIYFSKSRYCDFDKLPDPSKFHEAIQVLSACPKTLPGYLLWQFLEIGEQVYLPDHFMEEAKVA